MNHPATTAYILTWVSLLGWILTGFDWWLFAITLLAIGITYFEIETMLEHKP